MYNREPKFMQELHKIREKLGEEWRKMSKKEMLHSINESVKKYKSKSKIEVYGHR